VSKLETMPEELLKLLMVMVLIDNHIDEKEVDSFTDIVSNLSDNLVQELLITRHDAKKWFFYNRAEMVEHLANEDDPLAYIQTLAEKIKHLPWRHKVIQALDEISMADGILHNSEKEMFELVKEVLLKG